MWLMQALELPAQFLSAFIRANQRQKISAKIYQFTKLPIYQLL
jgi:hypothetical protein